MTFPFPSGKAAFGLSLREIRNFHFPPGKLKYSFSSSENHLRPQENQKLTFPSGTPEFSRFLWKSTHFPRESPKSPDPLGKPEIPFFPPENRESSFTRGKTRNSRFSQQIQNPAFPFDAVTSHREYREREGSGPTALFTSRTRKCRAIGHRHSLRGL